MGKKNKISVPLSPFPNQGEIIRFIAKMFDTKCSNKKLDEYVKNGDTGSISRKQMIDEVIYEPIKKYFCPDRAAYLRDMMHTMLDDYLDKVKSLSLVNAKREEALPYLVDHVFSHYILSYAENTKLTALELSAIKLTSKNQTMMDAIISWFKKHTDWDKAVATLNKQQRDNLSRWRAGKQLPSLTSIKNICEALKCSSDAEEEINFSSVKRIFLYARMFDYLRKYQLANDCWQRIKDGRESPALKNYAFKNNNQADSKTQKKVDFLRERLFNQAKNGMQEKSEIREALNWVAKQWYKSPWHGFSLAELYIYEARWHLFNDDEKSALDYYKQAFEYSLFRCGSGQCITIEEAIIVAAKAKDMPFLKRLKNQAVAFGIYEQGFEKDKLDQTVNNKKSRSRSNLVEDWEVVWWQSQFNFKFPLHMFFKAKKKPHGKVALHHEEIKPDYKNPDKVVEIQVAGRMKKQPQLVWFSHQNMPVVVQKLLEAGASVDQVSDSGDSALLMALQHMNIMDNTNGIISSRHDLDSSCFGILCKYPHHPDTVNRRTSKKRLLPLLSAVGSGQPDIVRRVLELRANVDRTGELDEMTPLYYAIQLIKQRKNIPQFQETLVHHLKKPSPASRRSSGYMPSIPSSNLNLLQEAFVATEIEQMGKYLEVGKLREIVNVLLQAGANPNKKHERIKGYTPLLFSVDAEEKELFHLMLKEYGGNPNAEMKHPLGGYYNAWGIAEQMGYDEILQLRSKDK